MICRQKRTILNPGPAPALQGTPSPQQQPPPRRRRKPPNPCFMPWILQREERGCYRNLPVNLTQADTPGYQNYQATCLFYLIEERICHGIKESVTHLKKPLEVGLKLAITLRQLTTGKIYHSLQ